jgi:hypothetical protein
MSKESLSSIRRPEPFFLTPELIEAQGKNDRQFLAERVRLLLDAKTKHPSASFVDLSHLADLSACGCGCCCCCQNLVLPTGDPAPLALQKTE